ncbi:hypothetical protein FACS1894170_11190 [Planctomycetales bacterium]|nr:hypothetical protein FACS1894170_11190 [Planctomycetales bacterium]
MENQQIEMTIECVDSYHAELLDDGRTKVTMLIPKEFRNLWLCKLSDIMTTMEEITYYKNDG